MLPVEEPKTLGYNMGTLIENHDGRSWFDYQEAKQDLDHEWEHKKGKSAHHHPHEHEESHSHLIPHNWDEYGDVIEDHPKEPTPPGEDRQGGGYREGEYSGALGDDGGEMGFTGGGQKDNPGHSHHGQRNIKGNK
jgi:hypothetical protein